MDESMSPTAARSALTAYLARWREKMYSAQPDMAWLATQGASEAAELVAAVRLLDLYLTDKIENRNDQRDLTEALKLITEGETWIVYLSDGGYSRLILNPDDKAQVWLSRGLSLEKPKSRAAAIGLPVR